MVHIDAPVDAELDQHHGRSRAAFDVVVELPLSLAFLSVVGPLRRHAMLFPSFLFFPLAERGINSPSSVVL